MTALVASGAFAASGEAFYENLYSRGVAHFNEGKYEAAQRELRIAAFGFIESIPRFETANAYLVAAARQSKQQDEAATSLRKLLNAEKVERTYATLPLPANVRAIVDAAARALLTPEESAMLREGGRGVGTGAATALPAATKPAPRTTAPAAATTPTAPPITAAPPAMTNAGSPSMNLSAATSTTAATAPPIPAPSTTAPATTAPPTTASSETLPPTTAPPTASPSTTAPRSTASPTTTPLKTAPSTTARSTAADSPTSSPTTTSPSHPAPMPRTETIVIPDPVITAPIDVATQLRLGDAAIIRRDLSAARGAYGGALAARLLSHAEALRLAEGLYRARDFRGAVAAFDRAGTLARGEEPYRYYLAVALYESGQHAAAKRELAVVIPFIELTPDVAQYQTKINAAID